MALNFAAHVDKLTSPRPLFTHTRPTHACKYHSPHPLCASRVHQSVTSGVALLRYSRSRKGRSVGCELTVVASAQARASVNGSDECRGVIPNHRRSIMSSAALGVRPCGRAVVDIMRCRCLSRLIGRWTSRCPAEKTSRRRNRSAPAQRASNEPGGGPRTQQRLHNTTIRRTHNIVTSHLIASSVPVSLYWSSALLRGNCCERRTTRAEAM
jgi:hypothetical protein